MAVLRIAEIFGHGVENLSTSARLDREERHCPIRDSNCTKSNAANPLGVCSLSDGTNATSICPVRFQEGNRLFVDAARLAFGAGKRFTPVPEVKILRTKDGKKIGKIDFILAQLDADDRPVDFAALEVQAVYFSGRSIRPAMEYYLTHDELDVAISERRPDYRSSAQKRLMPQLSLKIPVFRRWGKKFFVAVDSLFYAALPEFQSVGQANAELTWLSYPLAKTGPDYHLEDPEIIHCLWDDILNALREGAAPEPDEIVEELGRRMDRERIFST